MNCLLYPNEWNWNKVHGWRYRWKYMDEGIGESIDQRSGNDGLSASRGVSAILQRYQHGHWKANAPFNKKHESRGSNLRWHSAMHSSDLILKHFRLQWNMTKMTHSFNMFQYPDVVTLTWSHLERKVHQPSLCCLQHGVPWKWQLRKGHCCTDVLEMLKPQSHNRLCTLQFCCV